MADEKRQIPKQQERLESAINNLHSKIGELEEGLSPLMTVATPSPGGDAEAQNLVDYAAYLCKMADSVDLATDKIISIRARLQV